MGHTSGIRLTQKWMSQNNGSFYPHISPTSFYALQAKAATDEQATRMAEGWLMNKTRFCIARSGDYAGLDDTCYWGLPSIEANDPAYPALGYWRGYVRQLPLLLLLCFVCGANQRQ